MNSIKLAFVMLGALILFLSCSSSTAPKTSDTPTEAYKRLFNAVKAKNTDEIKDQMSKSTQQLAEMQADRQKVPISQVYENGFTGTTFVASMPEIRDERVKGQYGAVEVWNSKDSTWEDLPFVLEDGKWKLAFGEAFGGTYKSPGKGRDAREKEAANAARGGLPPLSNANTNMMANTNAAPAPLKSKAK